MTPQSVEDCLQSALSSLYPPFEVTAPTLLSQVFSVLERTYREDPLRYTLEFLIPAKRILQNVQHQACSQYSGFLFFHEGWPLCLGDKILIQLSSLPWHFLKPGDFYLQVVPYLECSPRLVLKCLSQDGTGVQEIVVPESAHSFLFSAEWLNSINKDRSSVRLENCLAAVEEKVLRLHWSEVIYPRFIHKEGFIVGRKCPLGPIMPPLECRSPGDGGITSVDLVDPKVSPPFSLSDGQPGMINSSVTDSHSGSLLDCIEGEYVELSPPNKVNGGKIENYRDLWVSRAKTAPSRKGKKKGYQAWLHEKKPGKIGSLSTLKQRPQDTWEERLCTGATGDKGNATVDGQNYWDVDATEGHAEADLVTEWRTGLEVLQRDDSDEIHSERQNWGSSEVQTWVLRDYSLEKKEGSLGEDRTAPQETDILTKSEESPLKIDHIGEREPLLSTEISGDITSNCQRHVSGDNEQGSKQGQNDTMKGNLRSLVGNCPVDFQLGSLQKMLKNREDVNDVFCLAKESSVCKTDRTWADGQETTAIQEGLGENTTTEDTLLPSNETRQDLEKENNPTWNPITDTPQRTGRGRRKKRNKRGRGPLKTEANKGIIITSETKTDVEQEVTETSGGTKDDEERKLENEEKSDERQPEGLPPNAAIQSEDLSCMDLSNEPDKPSCPSPLPPVPPSPNLRCLHRDVNWDLMESGFICLTGGRDKENKALLVICPDKGPATYNHNDLVNAVSYLFSLLRPEFRDLGMTVIIDLRDCESNSECLLQMLKDNKDLLHNVIYCTLIVCDKENPATAPCDLLESNVSVVSATEIAKFVALEELPDVFGGERPYIPTESAWGQRSLVNLYTLCTDVLKSLEEVIKDLDTESTMDTEALITYHGDAMKKALNDERLQALQRDGGTLVARLQKLPYMRLFDPSTFDLYEKVDEALHRLVQLSNQRLQELEERLSPPEYCDRTAEDSLSLPDTSKHQYQLMEALEETRSVVEGHSPVTEAENLRLEVGVRIRGLEVSSRELADRTCSPPRGHVLSRGDGRGPDAPWGGIPKEGKRSPQRLLLDLLCSERSYVQCLRRSLEARRSCPASLALRGSLEQLLNFHTHFLRELQNCISQPLTVSYCFLQHADQLHLYSLYVKNRQKVELFLPAPSGSLKGRRKDQKDEEDSWAILQRPLEQLDQYQRFLSDLMQECDQEAEQERQSLCTARELVGSLVLHGKNLLAAEAIRGFEVDEKEHGRLLLKDVFTVLSGRKKSLRHVFLFQKLLLFSKLKSAEGGLETYGYKQSFKTADMGLTESAIEGDVKIELWFRRPKSRETVILQAENIGIKESWTNEITKLLWDQGGLNKDYRSQDTVSIASSHRSFLDIKAGFSAISERTVGALLTARGSRTRSSMALSSSEHSSPSPPSSLSFALTTGLSPRRLRSPGGVSHSDKINEESSETFTDHFSFSGGPVCLKSISPIREGERSKDLTIESIFPSTSV